MRSYHSRPLKRPCEGLKRRESRYGVLASESGKMESGKAQTEAVRKARCECSSCEDQAFFDACSQNRSRSSRPVSAFSVFRTHRARARKHARTHTRTPQAIDADCKQVNRSIDRSATATAQATLQRPSLRHSGEQPSSPKDTP